MLKLTDQVKITITATALATLLLMFTCVLYKLSKLREFMEQESRNTREGLVTIGLPWRRDSVHRTRSAMSSKASGCSVCKEERGHGGIEEVCEEQELVFEDNAGQEHNVFTGKLNATLLYKKETQTLVVKDIMAENIFPWGYTNTIQTHVLIDLTSDQEIVEHLKSDSVVGVHNVSYTQEFTFTLSEGFCGQGTLNISVWSERDGEQSLVGECTVSLEKIEFSSDMALNLSRKLFKKVVELFKSGDLFQGFFDNNNNITVEKPPTGTATPPNGTRKLRAQTWPRIARDVRSAELLREQEMSRKVETEILLSLSYLPTAERLSVVVMKAKNIELTREESITKNQTTIPNPYVKVCLIYAGRKIKKKKTSVKRQEKNPVYNESMIFDVPSNFLHKIGFLVTIEHKNFKTDEPTVLGRVVMGSPVLNNSLPHWNEMLAFPRRPVAAWHKVFCLG